jgi:L-fuconolactonase
MIIDGHAHVWALDPARYPWQPTFGYVPGRAAEPEQLLPVMDRIGVHHAILVQPSAYGSDHRFMLDTVRAHPDRFLPVGLIDPASSTAAGTAASLVRDAGCVGLRVNLSLDISRAAVQASGSSWEGLHDIGVPVCVRATPAHHMLVKGILARHQHLQLVVDHLELPDPGRLEEAMERLAELAKFEQCSLKIAGLARLSDSPPPYRDAWPLVRAAHAMFGSSRLLWGSDFPSADPDSGYPAAVAAVESMPFLTGRDRDRLLAGTSRELWGLPGTPHVRSDDRQGMD